MGQHYSFMCEYFLTLMTSSLAREQASRGENSCCENVNDLVVNNQYLTLVGSQVDVTLNS